MPTSNLNTIQFILDNNVVTIDFTIQGISPTTTVLNYLRSLSNHKGVKEGCAEGDCGACTVVIAEPGKNGNLIYKAINSCLIFLPHIHGKQIITVENLAKTTNGEIELHPVQQAMVDLNGSQCGYCTPGIVMAMFALYKNNNVPDRGEIEDGLAGNLCRCTGYQPILNATAKAIEEKIPDHFSENETEISEVLQNLNAERKSLVIITPKQKYFQPLILKDLFALLDRYPKAIVVNGSTDIALKQTKKFEHLELIIDTSALNELKKTHQSDEGVIIGSGISMETLRVTVAKEIPALKQMLDVFASRQIRQVATLGGNIATASPISDSLPLLFALNASVILATHLQEREVRIENFITGYRSTDLHGDEIIKSIFIPKSDGDVVKSYKVSKRKDLDISTVSAGFRIKLDNNKVTEICLAFGGMAESPK
ncbi:MAG: xanthine dehydrogenase small subunit, partial [Bacteroidales bacterium]|nr:xanthine dehydrogenase small subunit [Bacteroidales bacterium]